MGVGEGMEDFWEERRRRTVTRRRARHNRPHGLYALRWLLATRSRSNREAPTLTPIYRPTAGTRQATYLQQMAQAALTHQGESW